MTNPGHLGPPPLLDYVRVLENQTSRRRGELVRSLLESEGVRLTVQRNRRLRIKNLVVDFTPESSQKVVFSAHYDVVKGSAGANDNASGVAVLLGLCRWLRNNPAPVRIIFFDREEAWFRTPWLRLGLLGSLYYVLRNDLRKVRAVFNLEFCGLGDCLAVWPIKKHEEGLPAFKATKNAAERLRLPLRAAHVPWLVLSSDHLSFRIKGLRNAITLSLLPGDQAAEFERAISKLNILRLLAGNKAVLPSVLAAIHTPGDVVSRIDEKSLKLMLSLLQEILKVY